MRRRLPGCRLPDMCVNRLRGGAVFDFWNGRLLLDIALNTRSCTYTRMRFLNYQDVRPSIQPWQFRHGVTKRTCVGFMVICLSLTADRGGRLCEARVFRRQPGRSWPENASVSRTSQRRGVSPWPINRGWSGLFYPPAGHGRPLGFRNVYSRSAHEITWQRWAWHSE